MMIPDVGLVVEVDAVRDVGAGRRVAVAVAGADAGTEVAAASRFGVGTDVGLADRLGIGLGVMLDGRICPGAEPTLILAVEIGVGVMTMTLIVPLHPAVSEPRITTNKTQHNLPFIVASPATSVCRLVKCLPPI